MCDHFQHDSRHTLLDGGAVVDRSLTTRVGIAWPIAGIVPCVRLIPRGGGGYHVGVMRRKPIIGVAGGVGSGKSFAATILAEMGCLVIRSDDLAKSAYTRDDVKSSLRLWFGDRVFHPDGVVDRKAMAREIFEDPIQRQRVESLTHRIVREAREKIMQDHADDSAVLAFVWDTPLLFETGLNLKCDAVVFVDAPAEVRFARVGQNRAWDLEEWARRENLQLPLDKKQDLSHYVVNNTADVGFLRVQLRETLYLILAKYAKVESGPSGSDKGHFPNDKQPKLA